MNKKQRIRLNESEFNNLVKKVVNESVKKVLNEEYDRNKFYIWPDEDSEVKFYKECENMQEAINCASYIVHNKYYNSNKRIVLNVGVIYETLDNYDEMSS